MSGQSQAVNLGGMLSQIGNTLGKGIDATALTDPLKQTFRPQVDPNDPASLRQAADYQMRVGNTDQATLYTKQAELMAEKQKEANKLKGQQQVAGLSQAMQNVLASNMSPEEKQQRLEMLQTHAVNQATTYGIGADKVQGMASKLQQEASLAELRGLQLEDAKRVKQEQAQQQQIQAVVAKANIEPGTPQWEALKNSPLGQQQAGFMRRLEASEYELKMRQQEHADKVLELNTMPDTNYIRTKLDSKALTPQQKAQYTKEVEELEKMIASKEKDGFANSFERRELVNRINRIEENITRTTFAYESGKAAEDRAAERHNRTVEQRAASVKPINSDVTAATDVLRTQIGGRFFGKASKDKVISANDSPDTKKKAAAYMFDVPYDSVTEQQMQAVENQSLREIAYARLKTRMANEILQNKLAVDTPTADTGTSEQRIRVTL